MAVDTYRLRAGTPQTQVFSKDTTTSAVLVGDMVKLSSGKIAAVSGATDNLAFRGIAMTSSDAGSDKPVTVWLANADAEFDMDLDATTTVAVGDQFKINAQQAVKKCLAAFTDAIALATKAGTGLTTVRVRFKIPAAYVGDAS